MRPIAVFFVALLHYFSPLLQIKQILELIVMRLEASNELDIMIIFVDLHYNLIDYYDVSIWA